MGEDGFEVFAQVDLGAFHLGRSDFGLPRRIPECVDAIVIMEDRSPDFFLSYRGDEGPDAIVPLSRHGPSFDAWRQRDLKRLVDVAHAHDKRVFIGCWMHTSAWVMANHPELLLVNRNGEAWTNEGDLNPMRTLRGGDEDGVPFAQYVESQYRRLGRGFGFDGLFVGDGGLGFRQFGYDLRGLAYFDFAPTWLSRFRERAGLRAEPGCPLSDIPARAGARDVRHCAQHVLESHAQAWVDWNVEEWVNFYARLALGVHSAGGELMTYNVMNYGPVLALLHGADYRRVAEAGVDYLVFQTYDFAWGRQTTTLNAPSLSGKALEENKYELLLTRADLEDAHTRLLFTTEVGDRVEGWKAPAAHTIGEVHAYGDLRWLDERRETWRRAADGTVVTWASLLLPSDWSTLQSAFTEVSHPPPEPDGLTLLWEPGVLAPTVRRIWDDSSAIVNAYAYQLPARHQAATAGTFVAAIAPAQAEACVRGLTAPALPSPEEIEAAVQREEPFEGLLDLQPIDAEAAPPAWTWRLQR